MMIWRGGTWSEGEPAAAVSPADEGLFTTAGCEGGRALLWQRHLARLEASMGAWGPRPAGGLPSAAQVSALLRRLGVARGGRARIVARRREGRWQVEGEASSLEAPGPRAPAQRLAVVHWTEVPPQAGHKSLARAMWDEARERAVLRGFDDALLVAPEAGVLETSVANVVALLGGRAATPPAPDLCLPGVMRGWLLDSAGGFGLRIEERPVSLEEIEAADEVWITNALIGVRRVGRVGERRWQRWPVWRRLLQHGVPAPGWPQPRLGGRR